jgi:hypothetical protein
VTLALDGATPGVITPLVTDSIFLQDDSASDALKLATVQSIVDLAGGGGAGVGPNLLINGNFTIAQRGTSFAAVANAQVTIDKWKWGFAGTAIVTITQDTDVPNNFSEFSLGVDVTTADASIAAGDVYVVRQAVEGFDTIPMGMGASGAADLAFTFWVRSTITGIHCVAFRNGAGDRSYIAEYTIDVTDTWEFKTITLTGDLTGTWIKDNGVGLQVDFCLAAGSTFQTAAGAWTAGNFLGSSNQVNAVDNAANFFKVAQVKLEVGSSATAFTPRPFAEELILCKRYFQKTFPYAVTPATGTGQEGTLSYRVIIAGVSNWQYEANFTVQMRADPTAGVTFYSPETATALWYNYSGGPARDSAAPTVSVASNEQRLYVGSPQVAGDNIANFMAIHYTADAEL